MTTTSPRVMTLCSHCGGAWRKKLHPAHTYHCGTRVKLNGMKSSARDRSYPAVSAREVGLLQGRTLQPVRSVLPEGSGYDDIHMRAARKAQKTPWRPLASPMSIHRGRARPREGESTHSATHAGSQGEARVGAKGANIVALLAPLATWRNGAPFATWRNGAPALTHAGAQRPRVVSSRAGARVGRQAAQKSAARYSRSVRSRESGNSQSFESFAASESGIDAERAAKERGRTAEPAHSSCTDASLQLHLGSSNSSPTLARGRGALY